MAPTATVGRPVDMAAPTATARVVWTVILVAMEVHQEATMDQTVTAPAAMATHQVDTVAQIAMVHQAWVAALVATALPLVG